MGMIQANNKIEEGIILNKIIHARLKHNQNFLLAITGSTGCQPKGSKVLMANGEWKNIEDIKVGDFVLSPQEDGSNVYSKILDTTKWFCKENYDIFKKNRGKEKLYSCSFNHEVPFLQRWIPREKGVRYAKNARWDYKSCSSKKFSEYSKKSLSHVKIGFTSFLIDNFKDRKNCEIEPYTLGVFLGDGMFKDDFKMKPNKNYDLMKRSDKKKYNKITCRQLIITSDDLNILKEVSKYYPIMNIYHKKRTTAKGYGFSIDGELPKILTKYNLNGKKSGTKFIPKEALLSNSDYRKKLLAGLIDTDGYYGKGRGGYSITLKSKQLIEDIRDLVYSLGGRCGKLMEVKKGIKKMNFIGTYYLLNFYLGDLKLPLKLERKKRDVETIYLDSNRIAIDSIKNNKKEIVYGFTIDSESKWYITDNWTVTHNSGKSYLSLRIAEVWYEYYFKKEFNGGVHVCFSIGELMKVLSDGGIKKGDILILEEAGTSLNSLDFQNKVSKLFSFVLQSFRSMNIILIFNLPVLTMLNKSARVLLHAHFVTHKIDYENKTSKVKPLFHQLNQMKGKSYWKYPRIKFNGKTVVVKKFNYSIPTKEAIDLYEKKKFKFVNDLSKDFAKELQQIERTKQQQLARHDLTEKEQGVFNDLENGFSVREIADRNQCCLKNIYDTRNRIKKKGFKADIPKKEPYQGNN